MKFRFLISLLLLSFVVPAQITKGNWLLGGSASFTSEKYSDDGDRSNRLMVAPGAGYFFMDKLAGGIRMSVAKYRQSGDRYGEFSGGIFARYYWLGSTQKTNLFIEANGMIGQEKYSGQPKENKTQYGLSAGPAFFLNPFIAIEASINWQRMQYEFDPGHFHRLGFAMGIQVHFRCKRTSTEKL